MNPQDHVDALVARLSEHGRSFAAVVLHRGEIVAERGPYFSDGASSWGVIVVPDREQTVVQLGQTPAEARRFLVRGLDDLIASVAITA